MYADDLTDAVRQLRYEVCVVHLRREREAIDAVQRRSKESVYAYLVRQHTRDERPAVVLVLLLLPVAPDYRVELKAGVHVLEDDRRTRRLRHVDGGLDLGDFLSLGDRLAPYVEDGFSILLFVHGVAVFVEHVFIYRSAELVELIDFLLHLGI